MSAKNEILTRKVRIEKTNVFNFTSIRAMTPEKLYEFGFREDIEDGIWYDENPERQFYSFRVHVSSTRVFSLAYGGFDKKLGDYLSEVGFRKAAFNFNGTIF